MLVSPQLCATTSRTTQSTKWSRIETNSVSSSWIKFGTSLPHGASGSKQSRSLMWRSSPLASKTISRASSERLKCCRRRRTSWMRTTKSRKTKKVSTLIRTSADKIHMWRRRLRTRRLRLVVISWKLKSWLKDTRISFHLTRSNMMKSTKTYSVPTSSLNKATKTNSNKKNKKLSKQFWTNCVRKLWRRSKMKRISKSWISKTSWSVLITTRNLSRSSKNTTWSSLRWTIPSTWLRLNKKLSKRSSLVLAMIPPLISKPAMDLMRLSAQSTPLSPLRLIVFPKSE